MNLLDENILESERQLLRAWRFQVRQVGCEVGRKGLQDEAIVPLLHRIGGVTLFTRDQGFYAPALCHPRYCLVCVAVGQYEVAHFVRRLLRHPRFNTQAKRMGYVLRATHSGVSAWRAPGTKAERFDWP